MVSNMFYFHQYLGKWSNLTNIFQMGWNHQLENLERLQIFRRLVAVVLIWWSSSWGVARFSLENLETHGVVCMTCYLKLNWKFVNFIGWFEKAGTSHQVPWLRWLCGDDPSCLNYQVALDMHSRQKLSLPVASYTLTPKTHPKLRY